MINITKNQASERWDDLPDALREALCSEINSDFLWKTCEAEHLPDEKIHTAARITSHVLMGFLHPEDMANEIRDELGVDIRIATPIADAINQRIFAPLRQDIDKAYSPVAGIAPLGPKIIQEVKAPVPTPLSATTPTPATFSPSFKMASSAASMPTSTSATKPIVPSFSVPTPKPAAGPVVFRTESIPRPIKNAPDFHLPTIAQDVMSDGQKAQPFAVRPAVIELGNIPKPASSTGNNTAKVIHYSSLSTSLPMDLPTETDVKRTMTEITPQTAAAAKMQIPDQNILTPFKPTDQIPVPSPMAKPTVSQPVAPMPPMPTPQPAQPTEKVIQKDYSEG